MEKMMRMKNERCKIKKNNKLTAGFYIFPIIIFLSLVFLPGAYYEKNIYYKLEDIEIEIGENLPEEIYNNLKLLSNNSYEIETDAPKNEDGIINKIGEYQYYLVYNDKITKSSRLTNVKAKITIVDTTKPTIQEKENKKFKYNSVITANDVATCYDLTKCNLSFENTIDNKQSGTQKVTIVATDEGNNKAYLNTEITVEEKPKPKPVYNFYYPYNIEYMNKINQEKNKNLTLEEKNNLRYQIASYSKQFIGNPYVYGGTSLTNGTDCSGFTMSIYSAFGYMLPRIATSQIYSGINITYDQLLPGDIIVYHYGHVGIYVGQNMMVHAGTPQTGIVMVPIFEGTKSYRRIIY